VVDPALVLATHLDQSWASASPSRQPTPRRDRFGDARPINWRVVHLDSKQRLFASAASRPEAATAAVRSPATPAGARGKEQHLRIEAHRSCAERLLQGCRRPPRPGEPDLQVPSLPDYVAVPETDRGQLIVYRAWSCSLVDQGAPRTVGRTTCATTVRNESTLSGGAVAVLLSRRGLEQ